MKRMLTALLVCLLLFTSVPAFATDYKYGDPGDTQGPNGEEVATATGGSTTVGVIAILPDLTVTFKVVEKGASPEKLVPNGHITLTAGGQTIHATIVNGYVTVKLRGNQPYHYTVNNATGYEPYSTVTGQPVTFTKDGQVELVELVPTPPPFQVVELTIRDRTTKDPLPNAYVTLVETAPDGTSVTKRYSADENGKVLMNMKANYTYSYVVDEGNGLLYEPHTSASITYTNTSATVIRDTIWLVPKAAGNRVTVTLIVRSDATKALLPGATVTVNRADGTVEIFIADAKGEVKLTLNKLERVSYTVSMAGYESNTRANVAFGKDMTRTEYLATASGTGPGAPVKITFVVKDDRTGATMSNATVTVKHGDGTTETVTTDANGVAVITAKVNEKFDYTVSKDKYNTNSYTNVFYSKDTQKEERLTSPNDGTMAMVTFTAVDKNTHAVLPNATITVTFADGSFATVTTNADGKASVQVPTVQTIHYTIAKAGYLPLSATAAGVAQDAVIPSELEQVEDGSGKLDPNGPTYSVVVEGADGKLLPGATVQLYNQNGVLLGTQQADAQGLVHWNVQADGRYYVVAAAQGFVTTTSPLQTVTVNTSTKVVLQPNGVQPGIDYDVRVYVVEDETRREISGARVEMYAAGGAFIGSGTDSPMNFRVPLGSYYFIVSKSGYDTYTTGNYLITPDANTRTMTIPLTKSASPADNELTGWVENKKGNPIEDAEVVVYDRNGNEVETLYTDEYGMFSLYLPDGSGYYVRIKAEGYKRYTSNKFFISRDIERTFVLSKPGEANGTGTTGKDPGNSPNTGEACMLHWYILAAIFISAIYPVLHSGKKSTGFSVGDWLAGLAVLIAMMLFALRVACLWDVLALACWMALALGVVLAKYKQLRGSTAGQNGYKQ